MPPPHIARYDDAVRFLFELQGFGVKLGLENISRFLHEQGNPQHTLPAIHIAGSNGKGSTAAFLASVLMEAGYRTALYTSPHLVDFRERMRIQGRKIPQAFVTSWVVRHHRTIRRRKLTFFEATTALAFDWFRSMGCDIAVIETGLGGRLDATNVLSPLLTVITSISLEHTHILGPDRRSIAREKAGIAQPGVPCVLGPLDTDTERYVNALLRARRVPALPASGARVSARIDRRGRTTLSLSSPEWAVKGVVSGYPGLHQQDNLRTAVTALRVLAGSYGVSISNGAVRRGIRDVVKNSGLLGRCGTVRGFPGLYIDVAHNPDAMERTAAYFRRVAGRTGLRVIFGISADKELDTVIRHLAPVAGEIIAVAARTFRSRDPQDIVEACRRASVPVRTAGSVRDAVRMTLRARDPRPVLITGSHFVVGEALASLRRRKYLTISQ